MRCRFPDPKAEFRPVRATIHLLGGVSGKSLHPHHPKALLIYSQCNDRISPHDWVIDFDISGKEPVFGGLWRAFPGEAARPGIRLV